MVRYCRGVLGDVVCLSMLGFTCTSALDMTIDDGLFCSCLYRGARRVVSASCIYQLETADDLTTVVHHTVDLDLRL